MPSALHHQGALSVTSVCHVCQPGGMVRSTLEVLSTHPSFLLATMYCEVHE